MGWLFFQASSFLDRLVTGPLMLLSSKTLSSVGDVSSADGAKLTDAVVEFDLLSSGVDILIIMVAVVVGVGVVRQAPIVSLFVGSGDGR